MEVLEHGSFSAAARQLNLTQPAVSLQIRELERRFGVRLIERMGKQAHATRRAASSSRRRTAFSVSAIRRSGDAPFPRRLDRPRAYRHDEYRHDVGCRRSCASCAWIIPASTCSSPTCRPATASSISSEQARPRAGDAASREDRLRITPLRPQKLMAIFPAGTRDVPDKITPDYVARTTVPDGACARGRPRAGDALAGGADACRARRCTSPPSKRSRPPWSRISACRSCRMWRSPSARPTSSCVRLRPPVPCTLALIEHRNKPGEPALEIVRNALLELRADGKSEPKAAKRRDRRRKVG